MTAQPTFQQPAPTNRGHDAERVLPRRKPLRWVMVTAALVLLAVCGHSMVTNSRFQWGVVGRYLFTDTVLLALLRTVELTVIAMVIGTVGGAVLALMRLSDNALLSGVSWLYIWIFRGTPVLVQILFWGFISALYPKMSLGIPFGPTFASVNSNLVVTTFVAAILGLGLNEAAYMAEIMRAGILSVDHGQTEAAQALGMSRGRLMRRIVLPQAMRVIIPPAGNETISMLKTTSLVSVISYTELLYSIQIIYSRTYQTIPMLLVASIWYLAVTSVLSIGQYYLERRFARGASYTRALTPMQRLRRFFGTAARQGRPATNGVAP